MSSLPPKSVFPLPFPTALSSQLPLPLAIPASDPTLYRSSVDWIALGFYWWLSGVYPVFEPPWEIREPFTLAYEDELSTVIEWRDPEAYSI